MILVFSSGFRRFLLVLNQTNLFLINQGSRRLVYAMPPSKHPGHFPSSDATAISNKECEAAWCQSKRCPNVGKRARTAKRWWFHWSIACDTPNDDFQSNFRWVVEAWGIKHLSIKILRQRGPIEKWTCHWGISSQPPQGLR